MDFLNVLQRAVWGGAAAVGCGNSLFSLAVPLLSGLSAAMCFLLTPLALSSVRITEWTVILITQTH